MLFDRCAENHTRHIRSFAPHAGRVAKEWNRSNKSFYLLKKFGSDFNLISVPVSWYCCLSPKPWSPAKRRAARLPDGNLPLIKVDFHYRDDIKVTGPEVTATLAQLVSCVGCRRAVENLYQVVMGSSEEIRFGEEKLQRFVINTMKKKSVGNMSWKIKRRVKRLVKGCGGSWEAGRLALESHFEVKWKCLMVQKCACLRRLLLLECCAQYPGFARKNASSPRLPCSQMYMYI